MKKAFCLPLLAVLGLALVPSSSDSRTQAAAPIKLYVALDGNDQWSGSLPSPAHRRNDGPLATLEGARREIQRLKALGRDVAPITVWIRGGTYRLTQPFALNVSDSGTPDQPITYAAYPGEKAIISGGTRITTPWQPDPDKPGVLITHLPRGAGGAWDFQALFLGGQRATRARTPAKGQFYQIVSPGRSPAYDTANAFTFTPTDFSRANLPQPAAWTNLNDVEIVRDARFIQSRNSIARVTPSTITVVGTVGGAYGFNYDNQDPYYVDNLLEAIAPGMWYLNKHTGDLYYWPRPGEKVAREDMEAATLPQLVTLSGSAGQPIHDITLQGLTWEYTSVPIPPQGDPGYQSAFTGPDLPTVSVIGGQRISFIGNTVAHTSGFAYGQTQFDATTPAGHNKIDGNRLFDTGYGGVMISRFNTYDSLGTNEIADNTVHDFGVVSSDASGIVVYASGHNAVVHNLVYNGPFSGINIGGGLSIPHPGGNGVGNTIAYNNVHDVMQELNDGGAIYLFFQEVGDQIHHNALHDVGVHHCPYGLCVGLYIDEGATDITVRDNAIYRNQTAVMLHTSTGSPNRSGSTLTNNIFVDGLRNCLVFQDTGYAITHNIIYYGGHQENILPFLGAPSALISADYNLYYNRANPQFWAATLASWRSSSGFDAHSSFAADPRFQDYAHDNFSLMPGSPALSLGFHPFDLSSIGPRPMILHHRA